ncbi:MAG: AsmA-like C-terminal region-containing protein [Candidatus Omnitrophota bacterium]
MKKLLIIVLTVILFIGGGLYYVKSTVLPQKIKTLIAEKGEEFLGRSIRVNNVTYTFGRGVTVTGIRVVQKNAPQDTLLQADEVSLKVLLWPLLKNRKFIIPSVTVSSPEITLVRDLDKTWNVADLLTAKPSSGDDPLQVYVGGIAVNNAAVTVKDIFTDTAVSLTELSAETRLNLPASISLTLSGQINRPEQRVSIKADYSLRGKTLSGDVELSRLDNVENLLSVFPLPASPKQLIIPEHLNVSETALNFRWNRKSGSLQASGKTGASGKTLLTEDMPLAAEFTANDIKLRYSTEALSLEGKDIDIKDLSFKNPSLLLNGSFTVKALSVIRRDGTLDITSRFSAENPVFSSAETRATAKTIPSSRLRLTRDAERVDLESNWDIKGLDVRHNTVHLTGDAQFPLAMSLKGHGLTVDAPLTLTGAEAEFSGKGGRMTASSAKVTADTLLIERTENETALQADLNTSDLILELPQGKTLRASPRAELTLSIPRQEEDTEEHDPIDYSGTIRFSNGAAENTYPALGPVTGIRGTLTLSPDKIETDTITLNALNTALTVSGDVRYFRNPVANLTITSPQVDLTNWQPLFKDLLKKHGVVPTGRTAVKILYRGALLSPEDADIYATADIEQAEITAERLPHPVKGLQGRVRYKNRFITWEDLSFGYEKENYTTSGSIKNFSQPAVSMTITNGTWDVRGNMQTYGRVYQISQLRASTRDSELTLQGDIEPQDGSIYLRVKSSGRLTSDDLNRLHPAVQTFLAQYSAEGRGSFQMHYSGPLKRWQNAVMTGAIQARRIQIKTIEAENLNFSVQQDEAGQNQTSLQAEVYGGNLTAQGRLQARADTMPLRLSTTWKNIDLAQLVKAVSPPKNSSDLSGNLSGKLFWEGSFTALKDGDGQGEIDVRSGHLWKGNFLKGALSAVLIPEYKDIVFTDLDANFRIKERRVSTKNLRIRGNLADLYGEGSIGFDQTLDFSLSPDFKESKILESDSLKKGTTAILTQTRDYISIKLGGTIGSPDLKVNTRPEKLLKKTTDTIVDGMGSLLEDLFK